MSIREAKLAATHPGLARSLQVAGEAQLALGNFELARAPLERAVAICEAAGLDRKLLALNQWALARAVALTDEARAVELAKAALAGLEGSSGHERTVSELPEWLAVRP